MNRPGMTLVEVIVALTISILALGIGYAAFGATLDAGERTPGVVDPFVRAAAARFQLAAMVACAQVRATGETAPFVGEDGAGADDRLTFTATAAAPYADGSARVRLYVDHLGATPEEGLVAAVWPPGALSPRRVALNADVAGLDASYLVRGVNGERWDPVWQSPVHAPLAVRILLRARGGEARRLIELPLVVPLGGQR